jgi:hypothetical protein
MSWTRAFTRLLLAATACTSTEPKVQASRSQAPPKTADEPDDPGETAKAKAEAAAGEPSPAVLQKICTHLCAGPYATIAVFRDAQGVATRLRFDGDLQVCSHPPRVWYDAEGREVYAVGEFPVVAGSEEAKALIAEEEAAQAGTTEAESLRCPTP